MAESQAEVVHGGVVYDMTVDTSQASPESCAAEILREWHCELGAETSHRPERGHPASAFGARISSVAGITGHYAPRTVFVAVIGTLLSLAAASCSSPGAEISAHALSSSTLPTSPTSMPSTSVTGPPGVSPSTVINTYPNPYDPGYSTINQLVRDSTFIVLGTLGPAGVRKDQSGRSVTVYPISVQQSLGTVPPTSLNVSQAEVTAAHLGVGDAYVFFWGADPTDKTACIVGGVRGVMAYDAATGTVTMLGNSTSSQIPKSQTLEQLNSSVYAAQELCRNQPIRNQPPICSPSATEIG